MDFKAHPGTARREMSRFESLLSQVHLEGNPLHSLLARMHRGDAFTRVFSFALIALVWILGVVLGLGWFVAWSVAYTELERWQLVLAFFHQFVWLGLWYVLLHLTYLRARHLRRIPPGPFVSMRAAALLLRWFGEFAFILAVGSLAQAVLGVPITDNLASLSGGMVSQDDLQIAFKALSLFATIWFPFVGFFVFTCSYVLAGTIEVLFAIERNTRAHEPQQAAGSEMTGRGREAPTSRENPTPSTF